MPYVERDGRRREGEQEEPTFWDHHQEIVRRLVMGQQAVDIARDMNITPQTVSNVRNSPLVRKQMKDMQRERTTNAVSISERLKSIANKAVDILEDSMDDPDAPWADRIRSARDVLDRAGHSPVRRSENVTAHLTPEELAAIKERARNNGIIMPSEPTEEAQYEEVKE